jgi:SAM-dependent methyltransferase
MIRRRRRATVPAEPEPVPDLVLTDFNHLLHELRTIELRHLPVHGGTLLSAGCAGEWYFDWIADSVGPLARHIGVELYESEPASLPPGVTWISESASRMPGVADASVDVVFSGQNIEHLPPADIVGFLLESRRVLRPGGTLVVDSPNRLATEALGWVHPEHTIELTAAEATALFALAGFDTTVVRGLWNCRDARTGGWLPLPASPGAVREILDRATARRGIDDSFVWWIEAERSTRPVDATAVRAEVERLFALHWPTRVNRDAVCCVPRSAAGTCDLPIGACGTVYRTRPFPLFPGPFEIVPSDPALTVVVRRSDGSVLAEGSAPLAGELTATEFGVTVELSVDPPLTAPLDDVRVDVETPNRPSG